MTVWYLIVMLTSGSGAVLIPQPSEQQCKQQANYIMDHRMDARVPSYAYCVSGVKQ
jgi:hypothetical protein